MVLGVEPQVWSYCQECAVLRKKFKEDIVYLLCGDKFFKKANRGRTKVDQAIQKKEEEKRIAEEQAAKDRSWKIPICYDDDEDNTIAITPVLPIEEPDNSLSMGDEHLDTIPETESDEVIKSSVENLIPIPSESEGIPDKMCDVPLGNNPTPLNALNEHYEIVVNSDDDNSSSDDDSYENIDYVDASPPDVEIVSLEVVEIVDPEVGRIDDDILLTIKDDILREKLLNVNLLIAKIDALRDNPTPSSEVVIKSTSTFPNLFLEETNTFDNSFPESETFRFNLEEISSGSPTTHSELSLPDYKAFYVDNDHFKERSSGSTTTHVDFSQYDSFIFDLSNDQFPPADRSDFNHEEFADELTHIMSLPNLECFKFKIEPDPGDLTSIDLGIRKNVSTTNVNVPLEDDQSSLFAYVVWIFLAFLTISRIVKTLVLAVLPFTHKSFTSSASFWESIKEEHEEKNIAEKAANHRTHTPEFLDRFKLTYKESTIPLNNTPHSPDSFALPPQPQYETYSCELCGNNAHYEQEEQAAFTPYWKCPVFDEDDDEYTFQYKEYLENSSNAIIPYLSAKEPDNSLSMGDEHLDIIPETESDESIKSSVENLVPTPSESEVFFDNESECDVLVGDDFTTFSNPLFDSDDDFSSSDDESFSDEKVPKEIFKIYSNSLFDEEIISSKIDLHHFNSESVFIESLLSRDILTVSYPKIDSLFEEFSGELAHVDLIPPRINEAYLDSEEDILLAKKSLDKNSSPRPLEELNSEISDAIIESFSHILVEDSDSLREEIDIFLAPDDSIPPGIENDDYDSEGDDLFLKELLNNDYVSLPEYESFHFDSYNVPSSPRPPEKPPDDDVYFFFFT
ncbi:hypothetical protein Tco_0877008 [Tanacetum coccineum]|uniref:Uncharacterized protein n=1 Tax=Tanacetum coccineum TaxID=301880 RepID=A0ABQ5BWT9_9ASTR